MHCLTIPKPHSMTSYHAEKRKKHVIYTELPIVDVESTRDGTSPRRSRERLGPAAGDRLLLFSCKKISEQAVRTHSLKPKSIA